MTNILPIAGYSTSHTHSASHTKKTLQSLYKEGEYTNLPYISVPVLLHNAGVADETVFMIRLVVMVDLDARSTVLPARTGLCWTEVGISP